MADIVPPEKRSEMMAGIKASNTKPEQLVRSMLHRIGFRFRLHKKKLPGTPDLVFPKYKAVIFIHGCYWHRHDCSLYKLPSSNVEFWDKKLSGNRERDIRDIESLNKLGWRVMVIWECSIRGKGRLPLDDLAQLCSEWLAGGEKNADIRGL